MPGWRTFAIDGLFEAGGATRPGQRLRRGAGRGVRPGRARPSRRGASVVVLSDRHANAEPCPVPACCWSLPCTITWWTRSCAPGSASSSRRARPATVHHLACLISYGAAAVNPYLAFDTVVDQVRRGAIRACRPARPAQLREGAQQGRPQDHVEDGHLDGGVLYRRPGLRGRRAWPATWSSATSRGRSARSRASAWRASRPRPWPGTGPPGPSGRASWPTGTWTGRGLAVAPRGRVPPLQPRDGVQAPARHPGQELQDLQGVHARRRRPVPQPGDPAGPAAGPPAAETGRRPCPWTRSSRSARS